MNKQIEFRNLSERFFVDYPSNKYPEIESKAGRPYVVLLVKIKQLTFAIPLRSNVRHSYCYKFKNSDRKTNSSTGLDFTKAIVVLNDKYLGKRTSINNKEYLEIQKRAFFIIQKFKKFVEDYAFYKKGKNTPFLKKKFEFCTLKYFDKEILQT